DESGGERGENAARLSRLAQQSADHGADLLEGCHATEIAASGPTLARQKMKRNGFVAFFSSPCATPPCRPSSARQIAEPCRKGRLHEVTARLPGPGAGLRLPCPHLRPGRALSLRRPAQLYTRCRFGRGADA